MESVTAKIRIGQLTESELEIVIESLREVCNKFDVLVSDPVKPEPMYREVILTGDFWNVSRITNLMGYCKEVQ